MPIIGILASGISGNLGPVDQWTSIASPPIAFSNQSGAAISGVVYMAGGTDGTSELSTTYAYNIGSNTWSTKASMPATKTNGSAAAVGNIIYFFAGISGSTAEK
jgi:hypothetical protein